MRAIDYALRQGWASLRRGGGSTAFAIVAIALAMSVLGLFEYNFGDSEVLMLFLFFATLPSAARRLEETQGSRA